MLQSAEELKNIVKEKYGSIAQQGSIGCCNSQVSSTSSSCCGPTSSAASGPDYSAVKGHYAEADLGLGCGIPTQFANITEGQTVLDLGSGAGNDVFVARSLVGETGKVIGIDMTEEMIARAKQNQENLGYENVEFRLGDIETLPVAQDEVDVVVSNCVLNLVPDKQKAFQEIYRVLKPGGHFCISDIVLRGELPDKIKTLAEMYVGCVAGALQRDEYLNIIQETGFRDIDVKRDHPFTVSEEILKQYLTPEDIKLYRDSNNGAFSITVFGRKPLVTE